LKNLRFVWMTAVIATLFSSAAFAQKSKYEFNFGYEFLRHEQESFEENFPMGWSAGFAWNTNRWLSLVGDVGGSYKSLEFEGVDVLDMSIHSFLAGPRFSRSRGKVAPYGQVLAGFARGSVSVLGVGLESSSEFALQPGGGVDFFFNETFGARVGADYRRIFADEGLNEFRIIAGVIVGFGGPVETVN
jgi:Outer membrane protein beta-barrel domain